MKFEHKFYSETEEQGRQALEQLLKERNKGGRQEAEEERRKAEAAALIAEARRREKLFRHIPNADKCTRFLALYDSAIRFAEYMSCDICMDSDLERSGRISLTGDMLIIQDDTPADLKAVFTELLREAETVTWTGCRGEQFLLELDYTLADRVYQG